MCAKMRGAVQPVGRSTMVTVDNVVTVVEANDNGVFIDVVFSDRLDLLGVDAVLNCTESVDLKPLERETLRVRQATEKARELVRANVVEELGVIRERRVGVLVVETLEFTLVRFDGDEALTKRD